MKNKKMNDNDKSMKFLCTFIVVIAFTLAFALLINKQEKNNLADVGNNKFSITPERGKVIVAKDMAMIYPKYYVVYFDNDMYSIYAFNYYETISQYNLEFNRLIDSIVDYNKNEKMIRVLHSRGYGSYDDVLEELSVLVNSNELKIY